MCFSVEVLQDEISLQKNLMAKVDHAAFNELNNYIKLQMSQGGQDIIKELFNLKRRSKSFFKIPKDDGVVFPNYFAPVLISNDQDRILTIMRYQVRPSWSHEEISSKYSLYNARLDTLLNKKTWNVLFRRNHAVIAFQSFYEWVERDGLKVKIKIKDAEKSLLYAPCLYDEWFSQDGKAVLKSFAIITTDPPSEISEMGHDRCPIILPEDSIDNWLQPENHSENELLGILKQPRQVNFVEV